MNDKLEQMRQVALSYRHDLERTEKLLSESHAELKAKDEEIAQLKHDLAVANRALESLAERCCPERKENDCVTSQVYVQEVKRFNA